MRQWVVLAFFIQLRLHLVIGDEMSHLEGYVHVELGEVAAVEGLQTFFLPGAGDTVKGVFVR